MFRRAQLQKREKVGYFNILTPLKDYWNVKLTEDEAHGIDVAFKKLGHNPNLTISFVYQGKRVLIMPDTLLNSIIEFNYYEKHWWGLKKL